MPLKKNNSGQPSTRKATTGSKTPEQDKYPPNGGGSRRQYLNKTEQEYEEAPRGYEAEEEEVEEEEEEIEEEIEQPRRRRPTKPTGRQQAQSRKTTRRNPPSSSTHVYREWNDVRFKGFLGKDGIQIQANEDGDPWCHFTLNVSQGKGKMPCFIRVTVWDSELTEYLDKNEQHLEYGGGYQLLILGQWRMDKSGDKYYQGVVADHVELVRFNP